MICWIKKCSCKNCGYDNEGKIIDNANTYFKIYFDIKSPKFIFIKLEYLDDLEINLDNSLEEEKKILTLEFLIIKIYMII